MDYGKFRKIIFDQRMYSFFNRPKVQNLLAIGESIALMIFFFMSVNLKYWNNFTGHGSII